MLCNRQFVWLLVALPLFLGACAGPILIPAEGGELGQNAINSREDEVAYERTLACVEENYPAESYFTNELLPGFDAAWEPMECDGLDQVRVGMSWILNDGGAAWYNAQELGYFRDVCLDVELVRGGSGLGNLQTLIDGDVEFAASAGGSQVPALALGPEGEEIVAVGALIKHSPYIWLGLDHDTPPGQRSDKALTPQDFVGKTVGMHEGEGYFFEFIAAKYGISAEDVELVVTGYTPDPVVAGEVDYAGAWLINEPRLLEEQGYMNWVAFQFSEWGWDDYSEVMVVRRETLEESPGLVRRYLAAVLQGLKYVIEHPEDSARIAVLYAVDAPTTEEQALRRYQLQESLIVDADELPLGHMSAGRWNTQVASMSRYDQIELPLCE